jgi:hypothetical protein
MLSGTDWSFITDISGQLISPKTSVTNNQSYSPWKLKMGLIGCLKTSVTNCQSYSPSTMKTGLVGCLKTSVTNCQSYSPSTMKMGLISCLKTSVTNCQSYSPSTMKMGLIGCLKTSVTNCQFTLHNTPQQQDLNSDSPDMWLRQWHYFTVKKQTMQDFNLS